MQKFNYWTACKITGWGGGFDSILEIKFAFSIRDEYELLHSPVTIFFDPATKKIVARPYKNIRRYTPDFLIRHKTSSTAFWIEIKPRAFNDDTQLVLRKQLAENYITKMGYDWEYKIVYDDEIKLSLDQTVQFNEYCAALKKVNYKKFIPYKYSSPFTTTTKNKLLEFIMFGVKRHLKNMHDP